MAENAQTPEQLFESLKTTKIYDLTGLVAVITGGSSGLGLMIATTLLANGATVYIIGIDQKQVDSVVKIYEGVTGGRLIGLEGDCSKKSEAARLAAEVAKNHGYINVLFNNAGIHARQPGARFEDPKTSADDIDAFVKKFDVYEEQDFHAVIGINTFGPYFTSAAFLKLLYASKAHPQGSKFSPSVINTASMNAWTKDPAAGGHSYPYLLSKSSIAHLTELLAHEFLPLGIRVNALAPGLVATGLILPQVNGLGFSAVPRDVLAQMAPFKIPAGATARHEDIASVAVTLITNQFMNGSIVLVDGGTLLAHPSMH